MDINTKQMKNPFGFAFYIVLVPEKLIVTMFIFSVVIKLNQKCVFHFECYKSHTSFTS